MQSTSSFLTQNEKDILKSRHRQERDKRLCDRIKSILLLDDGWSCAQVAYALLLDEDTIRRYYKTYLEGGKEALLNLNYTGKACRLNQDQLTQLKLYVKQEVPSSAKKVMSFIKEHFAIKYTLSATISLLHRLNFVYKKPKLVPGKANAEKQESFLKEIKELEEHFAKTDVLMYLDGVHPQHNSKPSYGWFEKKSKALLKANTGRQRININGALDASNLEVTTIIADSINAQSTISLFQKLEERYLHAKRIITICDNASYYRSKLVSEYLKNSRIKIKFLPPYSPNLNLIERLWQFMNRKVRNNQYYEKFTEFKEAIFTFFENISQYKEELRSLLSKKFHIVHS
ncbi:MAG: IS630 family transposase [Candidatus Rhabdochlamydia sp.]